MAKMTPKEAKRQQRHRKIRAKVSGTAARPRVSVYRSNQHVYVQVIDDENHSTIAALGTMSKSVKAVIGEEEWKGKTVESAEQVGKMLGQMCVEQGGMFWSLEKHRSEVYGIQLFLGISRYVNFAFQ